MKKKLKRVAKAEHDATGKAAKTHDTPVVEILGAASEVADQPPLVALGLGTLVLGALLRRPAMARSGARMLAAHGLATLAKTAMKRGIDRTRPARAIKEAHRLGKGTGGKDGSLNSFPSGHTAGAVAIAQAVARDAPGASGPIRLAAGAIGAMQVPRGKHYISDVLAGAAIGWLSERIASTALAAAERAFRRIAVSPQPDALAESAAHPS